MEIWRLPVIIERIQIEAVVLGRLISPGSERHTYRWIDERSALFELSGVPVQYSERSIYRASENIYQHKDALEYDEHNDEKRENSSLHYHVY